LQRLGDRLGAEAIGIGLDDGGASGGCGARREQAPVGDDRAEVDLQDRAGA
jgi:hypothetical protein